MNQKRVIKAQIYNVMTYLAAFISVAILAMIFSFILKQGAPRLSKSMIFSNYWAENFIIEKEILANDFENPDNIEYFSRKYGIAFSDDISTSKEKIVKVSYLSAEHELKNDTNALELNQQIERIQVFDEKGNSSQIGPIYGDDAKTTFEKLQQSDKLGLIYYKSSSGGIWGSLKATLMLIGLSLLFALPIGLLSAIYLSEIAKAGKFKNFVQSSIELLAGVPSIVFGLMGVVVLYPITAFFNIDGLSILLGSLTMAVILLPIIIRTTQESLEVVPESYRFASYALGATEIETIFRVVIPSALPGILSSVLLAISRIIGESAALIYTMGSFINDTPKIGSSGTSLAVHIWSIMSQEQPDFALASAISLIILVIVLVLNLSVKLLGKRLNKELA